MLLKVLLGDKAIKVDAIKDFENVKHNKERFRTKS